MFGVTNSIREDIIMSAEAWNTKSKDMLRSQNLYRKSNILKELTDNGPCLR